MAWINAPNTGRSTHGIRLLNKFDCTPRLGKPGTFIFSWTLAVGTSRRSNAFTFVRIWVATKRRSFLYSWKRRFLSRVLQRSSVFIAFGCFDVRFNLFRIKKYPDFRWLRQNNFATALFNQSFGGRKQSTEELQADATAIASKWTDQERCQHFNLILAMCVESLCTANRSASGDDRLIHTSLDTLSNLIDCLWSQFQLMSDVRLPIEIMNVLHR